MKNQKEIFCFTIENQKFALPLVVVEQVVPAMAFTTVPETPPFIHGLIDYHGLVIPVINLRNRLNFPDRMIGTSDVFILVRSPKRKLALVADAVQGVMTPDAMELVPAENIDHRFKGIGVVRCDDGMWFIYNLEDLLNQQDQDLIDNLMQQNTILST